MQQIAAQRCALRGTAHSVRASAPPQRSAICARAASRQHSQQQRQQRQQQQPSPPAAAEQQECEPATSGRAALLRRGAALLAAAAVACTAAAAPLAAPPAALAARASSIVAELKDEASGRNILTTASGIKYADIEQGKGDEPRVGDIVMVDLVLSLEDGTKIIDTRADGTPIAFQLGITNPLVTEGLEEVVRGMRAGSTRLAVVPPALGYGVSGAKPRGDLAVPGNADLYYEVELLRCQPTALGLACCSEAQFGERGGACIPEETLAQLNKMLQMDG